MPYTTNHAVHADVRRKVQLNIDSEQRLDLVIVLRVVVCAMRNEPSCSREICIITAVGVCLWPVLATGILKQEVTDRPRA